MNSEIGYGKGFAFVSIHPSSNQHTSWQNNLWRRFHLLKPCQGHSQFFQFLADTFFMAYFVTQLLCGLSIKGNAILNGPKCPSECARLSELFLSLGPSRLWGEATTEQHGKAAFVLLFQQVQSAACAAGREEGRGRGGAALEVQRVTFSHVARRGESSSSSCPSF